MNAQAVLHESKPDRSVRNIAGRKIVFDRKGFFLNFEDWSEEACECLARESGLMNIGDRHWQVIGFLRNYYTVNGRAPLHRQIKEGTGMTISEIEELFPQGLQQGARRLAGLPNPQSCS
jgi:tRNA 2-thiouridine synthesizing protein E